MPCVETGFHVLKFDCPIRKKRVKVVCKVSDSRANKVRKWTVESQLWKIYSDLPEPNEDSSLSSEDEGSASGEEDEESSTSSEDVSKGDDDSNSSRLCDCEQSICDSKCLNRVMPDDDTIESVSDDECEECKGMNGFHDPACHHLEFCWNRAVVEN